MMKSLTAQERTCKFMLQMISLLFRRKRGLCFFLFLVPGYLLAGETFPLLEDTHFERGVTVLKPVPKKRVSGGVLLTGKSGGEPVWELAQWGSRYDLSNALRKRNSSGALFYQDGSKSVTFENPGNEDSSLILTMNASNEYGKKVRKKGEPWPHLLFQQKFNRHPKVSELEQLRFQIDYKLLNSKAYRGEGWTDQLHSAQFLAFLTVQNRNQQSKGFGDFLWFGIPMYDARYRIPVAHQALDKGTGKFIYNPGGKQYTDQSAHDGQWITIQQDLLPLIRKGLKTAWERGFLINSRSPSDYEIRAFNIGWEVTGTYDVSMQIRHLNLEAQVTQ